jgi:hypothetical protein
MNAASLSGAPFEVPLCGVGSLPNNSLVSNSGIHLGMNYSMLNEVNQNE